MRVIAGHFRSRLLTAPPGTQTRPTSDRLRETLFNVLGPRVPASRFADLYAGSGAVGIEAISRGAAHVLFAETGKGPLAAIHTNLRSLDIRTGYTVEPRGTAPLLSNVLAQIGAHAGASSAPLDLVFLDPPYQEAAEYAQTLHFLGNAANAPLLHPASLVIAEHARKLPLLATYGRLQRTRTLPQGDVALSFFTL